MNSTRCHPLLSASLTAVCLAALQAAPLAAQGPGPETLPPSASSPAAVRLTLEEAKQKALASSKLLSLAALNAESKTFAIKAARAHYFPQIGAQALYFHFNDDLGTVLATTGRTVSGPKGVPLLTFPATAINVPVLNQDSSVANILAVQPITDLLKVRQGVKIAQADAGIAQAQWQKGVRELVSGVEQLYWGLLAARRIQAGIQEGLREAEKFAKLGTVAVRIALVETRRDLEQVDAQVADLQKQLNGLLGLPLHTTLDLVEPAMPPLPYSSEDEVVGLALVNNPDIHEAQQTICKAQAALTAGKLDYVPSIAVVGGYSNQTAASYVQQDIGFIGVIGTWTLVDWGHRKNVVRERRDLVAMATLKWRQTQDDVREKAVKAFGEVTETQAALRTAEELAALRQEAVKEATTPEAMRNPKPLLEAAKDAATAAVDAVKADLAYRQAYVKLMSLIGQQ
jgi:outer membrane protein TolC